MDQQDLIPDSNQGSLSSAGDGLVGLPSLPVAEDDVFSSPPPPPSPLPPLPVEPGDGAGSGGVLDPLQSPSGKGSGGQGVVVPSEKKSKQSSKRLIIGGVIALVLLIGVPLVAFNLDKFSGDYRERAGAPADCSGCAEKNYEWKMVNGECKKSYNKDCTGGGGGECSGSLSASACKDKSPGDRCLDNATCKVTTGDNCACVADPTPTPGPTPYCSRTCTGNFVCNPTMDGGECVIDLPTPTPYCTSFNTRDCMYGCTPDVSGGFCNSRPIGGGPTATPTPTEDQRECNSSNWNYCGSAGGCEDGKKCARRSISYNVYNYYCESDYRCTSPTATPTPVGGGPTGGPSCYDECIAEGNTPTECRGFPSCGGTTSTPTATLPPSSPPSSSSSSSGGSGGGGGCSSASAANCQGKSPGESCSNTATCRELTNQRGSDGKSKCECREETISSPIGACVETRVYTLQGGDWLITTLDKVGQYAGVGDKVRLAVRGDSSQFSQGRFRVNGGAWVTTALKNSAGEFYIEYTLSQAGAYNVEGQVQ